MNLECHNEPSLRTRIAELERLKKYYLMEKPIVVDTLAKAELDLSAINKTVALIDDVLGDAEQALKRRLAAITESEYEEPY